MVEDKKPQNTTTPYRGSRDSRDTKRTQYSSSKRNSRKKQSDGEYDKKIISIRRVSRTYKGGKRMRLSVMLVIGDKKGKVGVGLAKGADVKTAEDKAYNQAKKNMQTVRLMGTTIPHEITYKKKSAKILLKPAAPGTGVIAGGALRAVLEMAGIKDILTKVIGSSNQITNAYATIEALQNIISERKQHVK